MAKLRETAICQVRAEARRRIFVIATREQQSNDNAAIAVMALQLTVGATNIDSSGAMARRERIDAMRAASDRLEAAIAGMDGKQLAALDATAAERWPA